MLTAMRSPAIGRQWQLKRALGVHTWISGYLSLKQRVLQDMPELSTRAAIHAGGVWPCHQAPNSGD